MDRTAASPVRRSKRKAAPRPVLTPSKATKGRRVRRGSYTTAENSPETSAPTSDTEREQEKKKPSLESPRKRPRVTSGRFRSRTLQSEEPTDERRTTRSASRSSSRTRTISASNSRRSGREERDDEAAQEGASASQETSTTTASGRPRRKVTMGTASSARRAALIRQRNAEEKRLKEREEARKLAKRRKKEKERLERRKQRRLEKGEDKATVSSSKRSKRRRDVDDEEEFIEEDILDAGEDYDDEDSDYVDGTGSKTKRRTKKSIRGKKTGPKYSKKKPIREKKTKVSKIVSKVKLDEIPQTSLVELIRDRFNAGKLSHQETLRRQEVEERRVARVERMREVRKLAKAEAIEYQARIKQSEEADSERIHSDFMKLLRAKTGEGKRTKKSKKSSRIKRGQMENGNGSGSGSAVFEGSGLSSEYTTTDDELADDMEVDEEGNKKLKTEEPFFTSDPLLLKVLENQALDKILTGQSLTEKEQFALSQSKLVKATQNTEPQEDSAVDSNDKTNENGEGEEGDGTKKSSETAEGETMEDAKDEESPESKILNAANEPDSDDFSEDESDAPKEQKGKGRFINTNLDFDKLLEAEEAGELETPADENVNPDTSKPLDKKELSSRLSNLAEEAESNDTEEDSENEMGKAAIFTRMKGLSVDALDRLEESGSTSTVNEVNSEDEREKEKEKARKQGKKANPDELGGINTFTSTAPRLVMIDGRLQLDKSSLFVTHDNHEAQSYDHVDEGSQRYVTSASFSTRKRTRAVKWTPEMTERFYTGLSLFGTNFHLISLLFPELERAQIMIKFRAEEKLHSRKVTLALKNKKPIPPELLSFIKAARSAEAESQMNVKE